MTEQFVGETPAEALQVFIDEHCRANERETTTYSYQDRSIEPVADEETTAVFAFNFIRREVSGRVTEREYRGRIYEPRCGEYVIGSWETDVRSETRPPKPPGKTPHRLRGRRPRDRRR